MPDGEYTCKLEAALFFTSYALYEGSFPAADEAAVICPAPQYSYEKSSYKDMIGQVEMAYYPE